MFEWLKEPGFVGTHATMGADLSQLMATLFTVLFLVGWVQARQGRSNHHHWLVLGGMVAMLAFFTSYYLFRQLGVLAFEGKEGFGGTQQLYDNVVCTPTDVPYYFGGHWADHGDLHDRPWVPGPGLRKRKTHVKKWATSNHLEASRTGFWDFNRCGSSFISFPSRDSWVFHG